jgi:hypothetical protein
LNNETVLLSAEHGDIVVFRAVGKSDVLGERENGKEQGSAKNQRDNFHQGVQVSKFRHNRQEASE